MSKLAPGSEAEMADAVTGAVPLQRMGERSDIGLACVYLASSAANYVSGVPLWPVYLRWWCLLLHVSVACVHNLQ